MKILAILISVAAGAMILLTWGTTEAASWAVAFAGWVPWCFLDREGAHGNS